jgi:molybdate transport system substrate-binding protein
MFKRLGIVEALAAKTRYVKGEPVGACVARGEVEMGFQQISELMPVPGIDIVGGLRVADATNTLTAFFKAPAAHAPIRTRGMEAA